MIVKVTSLKRNLTGDNSAAMFSDITPLTWTAAWSATESDVLEITFDGDLTADQIQKVKIRCASVDAAEEQMLLQAFNALATIRTFNNNSAPTNAQVVAEVKFLGQVCIRLIQRVLGDYSL